MEERLPALRKLVQWCPFTSGSGWRGQHGVGRCWVSWDFAELAGVSNPSLDISSHHSCNISVAYAKRCSFKLLVPRQQTLGCKPQPLSFEVHEDLWARESFLVAPPAKGPAPYTLPNLILAIGFLFLESITPVFQLAPIFSRSFCCGLVAGGMSLPVFWSPGIRPSIINYNLISLLSVAVS